MITACFWHLTEKYCLLVKRARLNGTYFIFWEICPLCRIVCRYLQQGLAEKVDSIHENVSLTVKLCFEPKGRAVKDGRNYYATLKQNLCVVCGSEKNHVRKSVVPREYKIFFPGNIRRKNFLQKSFMANFFTEKEKDHKSHDVLILCLSCNMRLDTVQLALRRSLAETCNAPIACRKHSPFINDVHLSKVCKNFEK